LAQWQPDCEAFQSPALHIAKSLVVINSELSIFQKKAKQSPNKSLNLW